MVIGGKCGPNELESRSIHFNHAGVEVGVLAGLAGVEADAAHCDDVDEAQQHCRQAAETHQSSLSSHEVVERVVAVLQLAVAVYVNCRLPQFAQSLMLLNRQKQQLIGSSSYLVVALRLHQPPQFSSFSKAAKTSMYSAEDVILWHSLKLSAVPVRLSSRSELLVSSLQRSELLSSLHAQPWQKVWQAYRLVLQRSSMKVVLAPRLQSVPNITSGPTKKKIAAPRKTTKKTKMPMEYRANRQVPLLSLFLEDLIEPARPATPSRRKTIEEIQRPMSDALTALLLAELMMSFFQTWTQMVTWLEGGTCEQADGDDDRADGADEDDGFEALDGEETHLTINSYYYNVDIFGEGGDKTIWGLQIYWRWAFRPSADEDALQLTFVSQGSPSNKLTPAELIGHYFCHSLQKLRLVIILRHTQSQLGSLAWSEFQVGEWHGGLRDWESPQDSASTGIGVGSLQFEFIVGQTLIIAAFRKIVLKHVS